MHRSLVLALLASLAILSGALPGAVAEEEAGPTPAERFSGQLDRLPAPSDDAAFRFEGDILAGEQRMGAVAMTGVPTDLPSGARGWKITESVSMMGGQMKRDAEALLDRRLQPVRGKLLQQDPGQGPTEATWERTEAGFTIRRRQAQAEPGEPVEVALEGDALTTITALWLFCSLSLGEQGSYATRIFEPAPDAGESMLQEATWSLDGEGAWHGEPARLMHGEKGGVAVEAGFDPAGRTLLGADFRRAGGMVLAFRPASGEAETTPEEDVFAAPATGPENAALAAMLGFATGDVDLLEKIVHWPSVYAAAKAGYEAKNAGNEEADPFPGPDEFRALALRNMGGHGQSVPRAMIEGGLKMAKSQLTTEALEGGVTRVKFPEMFRSMALDVGERDGKWYLVRFPR